MPVFPTAYAPEADLPTRRFGWWDMWVAPEDDPRTQDWPANDERAILTDYLDNCRLTLELKCADLDADQLARRSVPPSDLSLLGLVRHLAGVEQDWFRIKLAGEQVPRHYHSDAKPNSDFEAQPPTRPSSPTPGSPGGPRLPTPKTSSPGRTSASSVHRATRCAAFSCTPSRSTPATWGQADLIRERIDGRVGQ
jgi:hypothetical protein